MRPADDGGERRIHARDGDHAVGLLQVGQCGRQAMEAGDAGVLVHGDPRAQQLGADPRLVHRRAVGGARRDDHDVSAHLRQRPRDPGAARSLVLLPAVADLSDGRAHLRVGPGHQDAPGPSVEQRPDDLLDLRVRLALGQHGLGRALAQLAVGIDAREAEVAERELGELLERGRDIEPPRRDCFEQLLDVAGEARSLERRHAPSEPQSSSRARPSTSSPIGRY